MPKLIDHRMRSTEITEAAWRVLVRSGARAVSVRNVAQEAGLATGSLRRAFPTQASLLAACLHLMGQRVAIRIGELPSQPDPVDSAVAALSETLPLDTERRTEMEVYLTLGTVALSDPELRQSYLEQSRSLKSLCHDIVNALLPPGSDDVEREGIHLAALVDGLALHVLHGEGAAQALDVLQSYLHRLAIR